MSSYKDHGQQHQWLRVLFPLGYLLAVLLLAVPAFAIDIGQGDLPLTITTNGATYDVTENITATDGFYINDADNVTINGHGYELTLTDNDAIAVYFYRANDCYADSLDFDLTTMGSRAIKFRLTARCVADEFNGYGFGPIFEHSTDDTIRNSNFQSTITGYGPQTQVGTGTSPATRAVIEDSYFQFNDTPSDTWQDQCVYIYNSVDCVFQRNTVVLNGADGHEILMANTAPGTIISGNEFRAYGGEGKVSIRSSSYDSQFTDNFAYSEGGRPAMIGHGVHRLLIRGNTLISAVGEALYVLAASDDIEVKNNLILAGTANNGVVRLVDDGVDGIVLYNNTIINYGSGTGSNVAAIYIENIDDAETVVVKNNILAARASSLISCSVASWDGLTADYNHYYQEAAGDFMVRYQGAAYPDLASWAQEANGSSGDPSFTTENWDTTGVWSVAATPPIDGGLNSVVDWALDLAGEQRIEPATNLVDQGAYEDQAGGDPTGACCNDDGTCAITTAANCVAGDETWSGADTVCIPNDCTQPAPATGACCDSEGGCTVVSEAACIAADGLYEEDDAVCDPNPCPTPATGACCVDVACSVISEAACTQAGGAYEGDSTVCDPNPCVGACCIGEYLRVWPTGRYTGVGEPEIDLLRATCIVVTEVNCTLLAGAYEGDGTDCDPSPCVDPPDTGACCVDEPPVTVCYVYTTGKCESDGGIYQGNDVACLPDPCNPPASGACCYGRGTDCAIMTQITCQADFGGDYLGDGTDCDPYPCPGGPPGDPSPVYSNPSIAAWSGYRNKQTTGFSIGFMTDMHFSQSIDTAMFNVDAILGWVLESAPVAIVMSGDLTERADSLGLTTWLAEESTTWDSSSVILPVIGNHDTTIPQATPAPLGTKVFQPIIEAWPERFKGRQYYKYELDDYAFKFLAMSNCVDTVDADGDTAYPNCNPPGSLNVVIGPNPDYSGFVTDGSPQYEWLETESASYDGWLIGGSHRPSWAPFQSHPRPLLKEARHGILKTMVENGLSIYASGDQHIVSLSKPFYENHIPADSAGVYQLVLTGGYFNRSPDDAALAEADRYFAAGDGLGTPWPAYGAVVDFWGDIATIRIAMADAKDSDPDNVTTVYTGRLRRNPGR